MKGSATMRRISKMLAACIAGSIVGAYGQVITFNSPSAWVTQRNDSITVRAQIDTAQIKKKEIALSVCLVNDLAKAKLLAQKTFKVNDYTGEFTLGTVKQDLVGGLSYIKIDWSIPGTTNKGSIAPVGIVALDKLPQAGPITVPHAQEGADIAAVAASVKEADFKAVGSVKAAFAWNKDAFYIILNKLSAPGAVHFAIDGKNGKNAFVSFADRFVMFMPDKDSLWGAHYSRQMVGDSIKYVEKPWPNELKKNASGEKIVLRIPWYDTEIVPFEERKIGFGVVVFDAKGVQSAALPATAKYFLPGTWGNLQLVK
jgi:hypothetical protein